jgi:hypothetical protein
MLLKTLADIYLRLWRLRDADDRCRLTWDELARHIPERREPLQSYLSALLDLGVVKCLESDDEGASFRLVPLETGYPGQPMLQ